MRGAFMLKRISFVLAVAGLVLCRSMPADAELADTIDLYWQGDYDRAFEDFHLYADQNHTVAQAYLAVMYRLGQGTYRNFQFSDGWKERVERFRPGDYERLLDYVRRANRVGSRPARGETAGDRARSNRERAQRNRNGVANHLPRSAVARGHVYYLGLGVPQDYVEAARWYYKAARRGDPEGQGYLGIMYLWGHGTIEDAVEAYKWLTLAYRGAPKKADKTRYRAIRDQLASLMTDEMLDEAKGAVRDFKPEAE